MRTLFCSSSISAMLLNGRFRFASKASAIVNGMAGLGSELRLKNSDRQTADDAGLGWIFRMHRRVIQRDPAGIALGRSLPSMSPLRIAVTGRQKL